MERKMMEQLEDGFCEVLKEYAERGMNSPECVDTAKAALSGLLKIKMLDEMENFSLNSQRSYEGNRSYRRSRDSYRRSRDYSGHSMVEKLEELRGQAQNENERRMLDELISKME